VPPAAVRAAAAELRLFQGVMGVFVGHRRAGSLWTDEPVLSVHVQRKTEVPAEEQIPPKIRGLRTDVIEVGTPRLHATFDTSDGVRAAGQFSDRTSALTAVSVPDDEETWALVSGHGTLPIVDRAILQVLPTDGSVGAPLTVVDRAGWRFEGNLVAGAMDGTVDFGVARFEGLSGPPVLPGNLLVRAPIPIQPTPAVLGQTVYHYGIERGDTLTGQIAQKSVETSDDGAITFVIPGLGEVAFRDLLVVRHDPAHGPFSVPGESGSLVISADRRAVGTVIGGSEDHSLSYVLPIKNLLTALGSRTALFFEEES
jgi:hypothetical protein